LARGGSGDVLTGLIGGLVARRRAQLGQSMGIAELLSCACAGVWWHAQAAIHLAGERGLTGVDPAHLAEQLPKALRILRQQKPT
jgi:NAD(P)H-hydrate epimerase